MSKDPLKELEAVKEELEQTRKELSTQAQFNQSMFEADHIIVLELESNGTIRNINNHGPWITGYTNAELAGKPFSILFATDELIPDLQFQIEEVLQGKKTKLLEETTLKRKDNRTIEISWSLYSYFNDIEHCWMTTAIGVDISDQRIAEDHLGWLSSHDPLTGLFNRRRFLEELTQTISTCHRYKQPCAVFLFDLDQFKDVNDASGHYVGDRLLQLVGETLRQQARESDIVSRLGGDEFAIIVKMTGFDDANKTAKRFNKALKDIQIEGEHTSHHISASVGVALYPQHGETMDELLANADIAMYQAKEKGRNSWHVFNHKDHDRKRIHERVYWDDQVKNALKNETLAVHFQPILDVRKQVISHYEALLRVADEDGKLLNAYKFITSAERNGLIQKVDEKICERVISHLSHLEQNNVEARLSINLSGLSFHNRNLVRHLSNCFDKYEVNPESLIFEITETAAVSDIDACRNTMEAIKSFGCQFALDDFGVGFSSLYYLKQLPVDFVKIDGSFIRNLHNDEDNQILVKALVEVSKAYKLHTVAEFVEDQDILVILQQLGVDYAQGYHIDQPKPFEATWANMILPPKNLSH